LFILSVGKIIYFFFSFLCKCPNCGSKDVSKKHQQRCSRRAEKFFRKNQQIVPQLQAIWKEHPVSCPFKQNHRGKRPYYWSIVKGGKQISIWFVAACVNTIFFFLFFSVASFSVLKHLFNCSRGKMDNRGGRKPSDEEKSRAKAIVNNLFCFCFWFFFKKKDIYFLFSFTQEKAELLSRPNPGYDFIWNERRTITEKAIAETKPLFSQLLQLYPLQKVKEQKMKKKKKTNKQTKETHRFFFFSFFVEIWRFNLIGKNNESGLIC
jgi:hypothetical protein